MAVSPRIRRDLFKEHIHGGRERVDLRAQKAPLDRTVCTSGGRSWTFGETICWIRQHFHCQVDNTSSVESDNTSSKKFRDGRNPRRKMSGTKLWGIPKQFWEEKGVPSLISPRIQHRILSCHLVTCLISVGHIFLALHWWHKSISNKMRLSEKHKLLRQESNV